MITNVVDFRKPRAKGSMSDYAHLESPIVKKSIYEKLSDVENELSLWRHKRNLCRDSYTKALLKYDYANELLNKSENNLRRAEKKLARIELRARIKKFFLNLRGKL